MWQSHKKSGTVPLTEWKERMDHLRNEIKKVWQSTQHSYENASSVTQKEILKRGAHSETIIKRYRDLVSQLHKKWGTAPMRTWTESYQKMCSGLHKIITRMGHQWL